LKSWLKLLDFCRFGFRYREFNIILSPCQYKKQNKNNYFQGAFSAYEYFAKYGKKSPCRHENVNLL